VPTEKVLAQILNADSSAAIAVNIFQHHLRNTSRQRRIIEARITARNPELSASESLFQLLNADLPVSEERG
jgi:hypothetical protein